MPLKKDFVEPGVTVGAQEFRPLYGSMRQCTLFFFLGVGIGRETLGPLSALVKPVSPFFRGKTFIHNPGEGVGSLQLS